MNRETIMKFELSDIPPGIIWKGHLHIASDGLAQPILVPLLIAKGNTPGPVLGITAVVHGNEINGLPVIQRVFQNIDFDSLSGVVIGVPVLNVPGFHRRERKFNDKFDLNHKMPGKHDGNRSEIYAYRIMNRIIDKFDYLIDLHTASFGRVNSYYVRADMTNPVISKLAMLQNAQVILNHKGSKGTLRCAAVDRNIPAITVELRDPHIFQRDVIQESVTGIFNILKHLNMQKGDISLPEEDAIICKNSYWTYTDQGGLLQVIPKLTESVKEGQIIAQVKDVFGEIIKEYKAPEKGIVIGKSVDPVNQTGSRILHLGIPTKKA